MPNPNFSSTSPETVNERFRAADYIYKINFSDTYFETNKAFVEAHPDITQDEYIHGRAHSIAAAAHELSNSDEYRKPSGYKSLEGNVFEVISHTPALIDSLVALDEQDLSYEERQAHISNLSVFNDSLKELIDNNPKLKFSETVQLFSDITSTMYAGKYDSAFQFELNSALHGMRSEVAAEQILGTLPDVEYRSGSTSDDLKGSDFFVRIDGREEFGVDIKASKRSETHHRQEANQRGYASKNVIWSTTTPGDFDDNFRISYTRANELSENFYAKLLNAETEQAERKLRYRRAS